MTTPESKYKKTSLNIASDVYGVLSNEAKKMNIPFTSIVNMILTKESNRLILINRENLKNHG
tara:strand:+ start:31 stop:216 length:186 start_codon:yes stop_codon:yes gene_type:complete